MDRALQQTAGCVIGQDYPAPIIDHATAVRQARRLLAEARSGEDFRDEARRVYQKLGSRRRPSTGRRAARRTAQRKSAQKPQEQLQLL
jgi:deoxyribodipyrimidine photo-lyase